MTSDDQVLPVAEVIAPGTLDQAPAEEMPPESISQPAKAMRIGTMVKQLLEEVRAADLDERGRERLRDIYDRSLAELSSGLSPDLQAELAKMAPPFGDELPSEAELRIAQAGLVGWLEGLFHGIQATLFAQQAAAKAQLDDMRRQLGPGGEPQPQPQGPGTYL